MNERLMTPAQRQRLSAESRGRVIASMTWDDGYWVITFDDGSEMCVLLMVEQAQ